MTSYLFRPSDEISGHETRMKYYVIILILHLVLYILGPIGLTLSESGLITIDPKYIGMAFLVNMYILNYFIFIFLACFCTSRLMRPYLLLTILVLLGFTLINVPIFNLSHPQSITLLSVTFISITVQVVLINIVVFRDIFYQSETLSYKLIGAASLYWYISTFFVCIYSLMELLIPGIMGIENLEPFRIFPTCYVYSFYILVGLENNMVGLVHPSITNIAVLEGIFSNLFIIFIVGRLLSKD